MNIDENNVFINCPFDNQYFTLLKPLLFTVIYLGKRPLLSETSDSGITRLHAIKKLMLISKYSIHDLSRIEVNDIEDKPRFNMPFECGIDFGIRFSDDKKFGSKQFLILEKEPYRYQQFLSDISGNDIKVHKNDPELVIKSVRDWLKLSIKSAPLYKEIWYAYEDFNAYYLNFLKNSGYNSDDIFSLTFSDIIEIMTDWIRNYKKSKSNS